MIKYKMNIDAYRNLMEPTYYEHTSRILFLKFYKGPDMDYKDIKTPYIMRLIFTWQLSSLEQLTRLMDVLYSNDVYDISKDKWDQAYAYFHPILKKIDKALEEINENKSMLVFYLKSPIPELKAFAKTIKGML